MNKITNKMKQQNSKIVKKGGGWVSRILPQSITALVLQQHCIDGYRAIQSVQDKAWVAGNGCSLGKTHNAVLDALGCSLRASQKAVIHVVALFVKGCCTMPQASIPCKVRLVANRFLTRCIHQYNIVGVLVLAANY